MSEFESKVVVVTGASAGVGRATVKELARQKARIGLISRNRDRLDTAKKEIERLGGTAFSVPADVAYADQVESAAEQIESELGPIDVWINNAMTTVFAEFLDIRPEEFKRATEVTYLGSVYGAMSALRRMVARDSGTLVQVGSALAYRSIPLQSAYCGAKHALVGFLDSIRSELIHRKSNVKITMVHMPGLNTPQFGWCRTRLPRHPQPVPPIYQPEVAARAIVKAIRNPRREVFIGWPTVKAIYGQEIAPGFADRYLARNAFDSQQTDQPVSPDRPDNLFETVPGDYTAHGIFDNRATDFSQESWMDFNRGKVALMGAGMIGLGFLFRRLLSQL